MVRTQQRLSGRLTNGKALAGVPLSAVVIATDGVSNVPLGPGGNFAGAARARFSSVHGGCGNPARPLDAELVRMICLDGARRSG